MSETIGSLTGWIDRNWYPNIQRNWDDAVFRERILARIGQDSVVLDLGAGAGIVEQMNFRGLAQRICGVDLDARVVSNPLLDEGRVADAGGIPYEAGVFDVVFADNVLEHLDVPQQVFGEIARVLKPGGLFLFKTPNRWHYITTIARLTPHTFHQFVNNLRGRAEIDTFPTLYRANTNRDVTRLAMKAGLVVANLERIEGRPEYLRMCGLTYLLGTAYERLVNATGLLAPFRVLLVGELRKPAWRESTAGGAQ
jgi:SAM-dependent methyltransferase